MTVGLAGYSSGAGASNCVRAFQDGESTHAVGTPGHEEGAREKMARVRMAHFSPDAPNVDVYLDGEPVLSDIEYETVTEYLEIPAGKHTAKVTAAADESTVLFEGEMTAKPDTRYTATAIGEFSGDDAKLQALVLKDDDIVLEQDLARLRVVHASPGSPAIDITAAESDHVLVDSLAFGNVMSVDIPPGEYTIEIRGDTETNDGDVIGTFDLELEENTIQTAFASGYLSTEDEPADRPFDLTVVSDPVEQSTESEKPA